MEKSGSKDLRLSKRRQLQLREPAIVACVGAHQTHFTVRKTAFLHNRRK